MVFEALADLAWHILPVLSALGLCSIMQLMFNCAKKPGHKGLDKGKDAGVQMNPLEVMMRFGKEQGTQLSRNQKSLHEFDVRKGRTMPSGMNVLQMHLYGELFKLMEDNAEIFKDIPPDLHPYCKLLRLVSLFYLRPEILEIGCEQIDQDAEIKKCENFDKKKYLELLDIIEKAVKGNKKKEEAVRILREAWLKKQGLGQAELAFIYNELGGDVKNKTKLDREALEKLLLLLALNEIITKEDGKVLNLTAKRLTDEHANKGDGDKLQMDHLLMMMEPEMQMDQGRIASRRRIGEGPRTQKVESLAPPKPEVPKGANAIQMYLTGELFKLLEDDKNLSKKVPDDMQELLKLLRLLTEFYMRKEMLAKEGGKIDEEVEAMKVQNFDKDQYVNLMKKLEPKAKGNKNKEHAFELMKEAWATKRGLAEDELAFVLEELGSDVKEKVKLDKIALNILLDMLVKNDIITKADQQAINASAIKVADKNAAGGHEKTVKIGQLSTIIEPEIEVDQGRIASRRKITQPKTQVIELIDERTTKSKGFFTAAPEDSPGAKEYEVWRNTKLTGDIARCMASGAATHNTEQHKIDKGEHPAAQQLLSEVAESFLSAKGFVATRGNSSLYSDGNESLQSITVKTVQDISKVSVAPEKTSKSFVSTSKLTMTQVGADKSKYRKIISLVKQDKEFMKDPERRKTVEMLHNAVEKDAGLSVADLDQVMTAISKDILVTADTVDSLVKQLVISGAVMEEERLKIIRAVRKEIGNKKGITMHMFQHIVSMETGKSTYVNVSKTGSTSKTKSGVSSKILDAMILEKHNESNAVKSKGSHNIATKSEKARLNRKWKASKS